MSSNQFSFEQVLEMAQRLPPIDQARLVARLAPNMEKLFEQVGSSPAKRVSLRGLLADLGQAPSSEEIDEVRREMWAGFGEEE